MLFKPLKFESEMKLEIKKLEIWKVGMIFAIIGLLIGIALGIVSYLYYGVLINQVSDTNYQAMMTSQYGENFNPAQTITQVQQMRKNSLWLFPVISMAAHFTLGIMFAFLYNAITNIFGGLKINVEEKK